MFLNVILVICSLAIVRAEDPTVGFYGISPRVVGGVAAKPGECPYQVSLQVSNQHFCGGSILNEEWIITAAHCVSDLSVDSGLVIRAGSNLANGYDKKTQKIQVVDFEVHPRYQGEVGPYDIALLKLARPLKYNQHVAPASLPSPGSIPKGKAILSGWGSMSKSSWPLYPGKLQTVKMDLLGVKECNAAFRRAIGQGKVHESNICTSGRTGDVSACSGDSGGPLIVKVGGRNELIGIVSWGVVPCAMNGAPSVYTRVSSYIDWIENITGQSNE